MSNADFATLIWSGIKDARAKGVFAETFGVYRNEEGRTVRGRIEDEDAYFLNSLGRSGIRVTTDEIEGGPPRGVMGSRDDLFNLIELLHAECVSEPARRQHGPGDTIFQAPFDHEAGQRILRGKVNPLLRRHDPPLELLPNDQIVERPDDELRPLVSEAVPETAEPIVRDPLEAGISGFLRHGATVQERRSAVKQLADALEPLRGEIKEALLSEDENQLFHIANCFAIRHNNRSQRGDYDKDVWLQWMFYVYVATARAMIRVRERQVGAHEAGASGGSNEPPF